MRINIRRSLIPVRFDSYRLASTCIGLHRLDILPVPVSIVRQIESFHDVKQSKISVRALRSQDRGLFVLERES